MKYLKYEFENQIAVITISRPEVLNALNSGLIAELDALIDRVIEDRARALIITGEGKNFAAGADIAEMMDLNPAQARDFAFSPVYDRLEALPIPVFAAIRGFALGGGLELALACDFRILSADAKLGLPEIKLGIMPGAGGTQRLPKLVGLGRAREMIFFGNIIDATTALTWGLCERVADGDPVEEAMSMAKKIAEKSPCAVEAAKKSINYGIDRDLASGIAYEAVVWGDLFSTSDQKEGMKAFHEKRKPQFIGK
ncbi:MAG: enoyl-CoA hydratase/isomerase family protein [Desulfomonilia bacterium]|jgi:enoyl-CoA hydratase|uniref:3-hydroxybutyryl-CoA dehydratase (Crotonase) n=1 Tax=anaerobic digester metagenome TaxID=1263854 RepID=A0A485LVT9_9ZZZZ